VDYILKLNNKMSSKNKITSLVEIDLTKAIVRYKIQGQVLPTLENDLIQAIVESVIVRIAKTETLLSEGTKITDPVIQDLWKTILSDIRIVNAAIASIEKVVSEKIENKTLQQAAQTFSVPVILSLAALSDNIKPDKKQLADIWKDLLVSSEFRSFLRSNVFNIFKLLIKRK